MGGIDEVQHNNSIILSLRLRLYESSVDHTLKNAIIMAVQQLQYCPKAGT